MTWRWYWAGGALTGYGLHWAQSAPGPFRLVIFAGVALGIAPAVMGALDKRARRKAETP